MPRTEFMQGWAKLIESLAILGIVVTALCLMLGIVELKDVPKRIGMIVGIAIVLIVGPAMLLNAWAAMSLLQRIGVAVAGFALWRLWRTLTRTRNGKRVSSRPSGTR
jgi:hypothetical protein